ncbi:MAG: 1,4-dihydroxy-2-naphthoate polyprenyltransferase [Myxococcales bacterium]|nr:MAG: 1,4-dihydroxy-2-naphthoate polyprenyltransferase [Myxococcales bacterium]
MTNAASIPGPAPSVVARWVLAARPKTLSAASVPVLVGSACAFALGEFRPGPALAALVGALLLQVGANFANDVYDYEKGADTAERLGPTRAVQAGLISPSAMKRGMYLVFAVSLLIGAYLTTVAGPIILVIGIVSILSAIAYTGGPYPLGYNGLGDLFVFVFFGLVAVCGTVFVQVGAVPALALWCSVPVGALATAILVVNNLRDAEQDAKVGKRTLAVRWGRRAVIFEYGTLLALSYAVPLFLATSSAHGRFVLLPLLTLPLARRLLRAVATEQGRDLNLRLAGTAKLLLLFGLLFTLGIALDQLGLFPAGPVS